MPAHLSTEQRDLIYKQRNHKSLITDPVIATLDGEEFTLKPIDRLNGLPKIKANLYAAMEIMTTKADWDNLPRLLQGLRHGGLRVNAPVMYSIARRAGKAGRQDVLLECARQAEATGFRMNKDANVRSLIWWFQYMAVDSEFDAEMTKKALAWSEQIFEMIELPTHIGKGLKDGDLDPRVQPKSVGILLELAAVRALKHTDGKDVDGKVAKYAEKMSLTSLDFGVPEPNLESIWVSEVLPALYGMRVALKILDPNSEVAKKLQAASDSLGKTVDGHLEEIPKLTKTGKTPKSLELYKIMSESL